MASHIITLNVNWEIVSEEPDGVACVVCGCNCYLHQWRIVLFVRAEKVIQSPVLTEYVFCHSCKCIVEEESEQF